LASRCTPTFDPGYRELTFAPALAGAFGASATYGLTVTLVPAILSSDWIWAKLSRLGTRKVKVLLELMAGKNAGWWVVDRAYCHEVHSLEAPKLYVNKNALRWEWSSG
jgi:hypothetical protein